MTHAYGISACLFLLFCESNANDVVQWLKSNMNNTLPNPIFYVNFDSVIGDGRIELVVIVCGSNRRRHKICTFLATSGHSYFIAFGNLMAMLRYKVLLYVMMIDNYYQFY